MTQKPREPKAGSDLAYAQDAELLITGNQEREPEQAPRDYQAHVGPSFDPYEDDPEARAVALLPLLGDAEAGLVPFASLRTGEEKLDFLLALPEPAKVVQALRADEFVFLAQDVGINDAPELLTLASPRQLQALADMDGWRGEAVDSTAILRWQAAAESAGYDTARRFVAAQEDGLLCLTLGQHVRAIPVHDGVDQEIPDDVEVFDSPDGSFKLLAKPDDGNLADVRRLVALLYDIDLLRARAVIKGLYWELPAQLQDDLADLRAARLRDLGFDNKDEALTLYAYADPHAFKRTLAEKLAGPLRDSANELAGDRVGMALQAAGRGGLMATALLHLPPAEVARVQTALQRLVYRVQSARALVVGNVEELPLWARHAVQTATMGLEHCSDGDVAVAAQVLRHASLDELFTAGHSLVVIEVHRARRLRRSLGGEAGPALLRAEDAGLLRAMLRALPAVPDGEALRPVASLAELGQIRTSLQRMQALVDTVAPQGVVAALLPAGTTIQQLLATALAWRALGQPPSAQPFDEAAVRALAGTCFVRGRWKPEVRGHLQQGPEALRAEIVAALQSLEDDYANLDATGEIDLRFVGSAVLLQRVTLTVD